MTVARSQLVPEGEDGIHHCWSRCVRRAFLCGTDSYTGKCYDHRKEWIRERIQFLVKIFAIDILAYAIMENHEHLVVRIMSSRVHTWTDEEVAIRWLMLYPKSREKDGSPSPASQKQIEEITSCRKMIREYRKRLCSLSWFMKSLHEHIARKANKEDQCTGSFWEGRFKSKKIEDEKGLLTCSVYVDLNPIRAQMAKTPEESDFTSIQERSLAVQTGQDDDALWIAPIELNSSSRKGYLSMSREEYLTLVDLTGRMLQRGKRGTIPPELPPILERLGIRTSSWEELATNLDKQFSFFIGSSSTLTARAKQLGKSWLKGTRFARQAFL